MKKLIIIAILLTSCATTQTYIVTNESGTEFWYSDREKAIEFHDKENFRKPLSVTIDSLKR